MKVYTLDFTDKGLDRLWVQDPKGRSLPCAYEPITMTQARNLLGRSRRHLYRYVRSGVLAVIGRIGGFYLLDAQAVRHLAKQLRLIGKRGKLPPSMKSLFPEYSLKTLDPLKDSAVILGRVFEKGTLADIHWALSFYSQKQVREFLGDQALRWLSPKSMHFWCWYFAVPLARLTDARALGRKLGGVA